MNLRDRYNEIFSNQDSWKYYTQMQVEPFDFENDYSCKEFIYNYFECGSKKNVFKFIEDLNCEIRDNRFSHMVSTYFLGILLSEVFFTEQEKKLNQTNDFRWIWFILCLYHDIGYVFEQNQNMFENILSYNHLIDNERLDINYLFHQKLKHPIYSQALIANYFDYRIKENKLEHGIIGGILLYDKLYKNYYSVKNGAGIIDMDFIFNGLSWRSEHLTTFAHLADIITAHNIWRIKSSDADVELYKKYNLYELIDTRFNKPKSFYNKLFYLLCICDAIEPLKFFNQLSVSYILQNIEIDVLNKNISINVLTNDINYAQWIKNILSLNHWLTITVQNDNNTLKIHI